MRCDYCGSEQGFSDHCQVCGCGIRFTYRNAHEHEGVSIHELAGDYSGHLLESDYDPAAEARITESLRPKWLEEV
jgi:hypothetical protein